VPPEGGGEFGLLIGVAVGMADDGKVDLSI
jgi:hypothetical protein